MCVFSSNASFGFLRWDFGDPPSGPTQPILTADCHTIRPGKYINYNNFECPFQDVSISHFGMQVTPALKAMSSTTPHPY